jgi:hypothetical protein
LVKLSSKAERGYWALFRASEGDCRYGYIVIYDSWLDLTRIVVQRRYRLIL